MKFVSLIIAIIFTSCSGMQQKPHNLSIEFRLGNTSQTGDLLMHKIRGRDHIVYLERKAVITGAHIASAGLEQSSWGESLVKIVLTSEGKKIISEITGKYSGRILAVVVNGEVITAPEINGRIHSGIILIAGLRNEEVQQIVDIFSFSE